MSHPLHERLRRVRQRARRLTLLHAGGWFLAILLIAFVVVGAIDFLVRSDETPLRFLATMAIAFVAGWAYFKFLRPAFSQRFSDLQIAYRIEQRFPQLKGLVANTVSFLGEPADDPLAGSHAMRRAVVSRAMAELEDVNLGDCLDARTSRRAVTVASVAVLAVALIFALLPTTAGHAASRLLSPWQHQPWPRRNSLDLVEPPSRLARGGDFEVEIIDRNGHLPDEVALEILRDDGQTHLRTAVFVGGKMLARVNNVSRTFMYRAIGGDDDTMRFRELEVVTPPELLDLRIKVTPPEYSGWPQERFTGDIRGLTGSTVIIQGLVDQPLKSAVLKFRASDAPTDQFETTPLAVTDNAFQTDQEPFRISKSGQYSIDFIDHRGVGSGKPQSWNIEAVDDQAPTVVFDAEQFTRYVTSEAVAPIRGFAEDDLALAKATLVYRRENEQDGIEQTIELWQGPARADKQTDSQPAADRRDLEFAWRISAIPGLQPGDSIEFHLAATDYAKQQGVSTPQRLTIVSRSELEDRLARDQGYILERIAEALRAQQEARKQVTAIEIQWQETKSFSKADVDQLQSAELNQRQVTRLLAGPQDGVLVLLERLTGNIADNRLNNPDLSRRVEQLRAGVAEVVGKLPEIQRPLLAGLKDIRPKLIDADEETRVAAEPMTGDRLKSAGAGQDEAIALLERLLGDMAQWENYRRFAREIGRLQREQADLEQRTDDVRLETLSRDWESLTAEQRAKLRRLAQEQIGLAQRLDKLQSRMSQAGEKLDDQDPIAAETLTEGAAAAQEMAISGQMREIARQLGANRVGQAKRQQAAVKDSLSQLLDILGNRREDELDRKLRKLDDLEKTLADLEARENTIADQLAEQNKSAEPNQRELERLAKEQQQLAKEAEQAARKLERLEAQQPSSATREAAESMRASGKSGEQSQGRQAEQQAKTALEKLADARQQLQQEVEETRQELFFERLARLEQNIRGLAQRQQSVDETIREMLLIEEMGELLREHLATLKNMSANQSDLGSEAAQLGEQVAEAKVFSLALSAAAREMARSASYLDETKLADAARASKTAITRLNQLIEALQPPPPQENPDPPMGQGGQPQNPPQNPNADAINQLAELKLVRLLQQEILTRTEELEKIGTKQELTPDQMLEYEDLSQEQGKLADILDDLIKSAEEAAARAKAEAEDPAKDESLDQLLLGELGEQ